MLKGKKFKSTACFIKRFISHLKSALQQIQIYRIAKARNWLEKTFTINLFLKSDVTAFNCALITFYLIMDNTVGYCEI